MMTTNVIAAACLVILATAPFYRGFIEKPLTTETEHWKKSRISNRGYAVLWLALAMMSLLLGLKK